MKTAAGTPSRRERWSSSPSVRSWFGLRTGPRLLPALALIVAAAILLWIGLAQLSTPDTAPASAASTEFSAERAMDHLRVIAAEPRPAGAPGHVATRNYLVDQLETMGLSPEVQTASVLVEGEAGVEGFTTATVENVVARIPGTGSTGAIALDAHYDSGATGPGAMDAGAGVVAILESVRAIQAGPPLANDVVIVFADGEETGMLGAAAFTEQHPWAEDVALTLNYEGAGGDGQAMLYATSQDNDWVVSEFLDIAPDPAAYSLLPTIVNLVPDARLECDLGEYTEKGSAGLGFVSIGDTPAYHTERDNPDLIDSGSIQQMGGYTLASLQHFGNQDLSDLPTRSDRVFFNALPGTVLGYPGSLVIPLAALATVIIAALAVVGVRREEMSIGGLALGALVFLASSLAATGLAVAVWAVIRTLNPNYQVMMIGSYQSGLYVIALALLTIGAITALYTLLGPRTGLFNLAAGALLGGIIPLWIASVLVPGMSYLVVWPLLFATIPLAWYLLAGTYSTSPWARAAVLVIALVPALALLPGTLYAMAGLANRLEGLMGFPILGVTMLFVAPLVALLVLHLDFLSGRTGLTRWAVPLTALALALVLIGWGNATSGFDADRPRPDRLAYELDLDSHEARWVSRDSHLDDWNGQFFPSGTQRAEHNSLLLGTEQAFMADAPVVDVPAPTVEVIEDTIEGEQRTLRLHLNATDPRVMVAEVDAPAGVTELAIDGHQVNLAEYEWARDGSFPIVNPNVADDGWTLEVTTAAQESVALSLEVATDDLPARALSDFRPRPPETMPAPDYARDPTVVTQTFRY